MLPKLAGGRFAVLSRFPAEAIASAGADFFAEMLGSSEAGWISMQNDEFSVDDDAVSELEAEQVIDEGEEESLPSTTVTEPTRTVVTTESTEDLAGIGLSVETATHDVSSMLSKALISIDGLVKDMSDVSTYVSDFGLG